MKDRENTSHPTEKGLNKIVELDSRRIRHMKIKMEMNNKKSLLTASLISIIAVVTFINQQITSQNETPLGGRNVASLELDQKSNYRFQWQKDLSEKLSKESRSIASLGQEASLINQIRFGLLEGKYGVKLQENLIQEIQFTEASGDKPKFIDVKNMVTENIQAFALQASKLELDHEEILASGKEEIYNLKSLDDKSILQLHVTYDSYGRFRTLKTNKL